MGRNPYEVQFGETRSTRLALFARRVPMKKKDLIVANEWSLNCHALDVRRRLVRRQENNNLQPPCRTTHMYLEFSDWELGNMSLYWQRETTVYRLPYLPGGPKSILSAFRIQRRWFCRVRMADNVRD